MLVDYDVVIVGGGMVGGCLALALCQSSLRVAIIEAKSPASKVNDDVGKRAIALSWGSRCLLGQLGLWESLQASSVAIEHIHVSDKGHFGKTRLSAESQSVDALGYVVAAEQIESTVNAALAKTQLDVFCPAELLNYHVVDDLVKLTVLDQGEERPLSCRLLVGADGGSSVVRECGCFELREQSYQQQAIIAQLHVESDQRHIAYERFTADGPIAMLPRLDGGYSLVWTMPTELAQQVIQLSEKEFISKLQQQFGQWLGELTLMGDCQTFPLALSYVPQTTVDRVVLIGNAAHQLHPVAGQGFNLGLRDAAALADALLSAQNDVGAADVLALYGDQRQLDQSLVIGLTDKIVKIFSTDSSVLSVLRNSGLLLMDKLPMLKNKFAQQTMGLASRLPRIKGE